MEETSFSKLRDTLKIFSEGKEASALLIKGAWGSGKTYACRKTLEEAKLPYGYVSLYGMSKRDEIYSRICLGWNDPETKGTPQWCEDAFNVGGGFVKSASQFFKAEDFIASLGIAAVGQLIEGKVIVIDDLERRDSHLSIEGVFGVINQLVDSRNCRVVVVCNYDMLSDADKASFDKQSEKLFENEFLHQPTIKEIAEILSKSDLEYIVPPFEKLKITNFRVMQKVELFLNRFKELISGVEGLVRDAVLKNAATLAALYYGHRDTVDLDNRTPSSASRYRKIMGISKDEEAPSESEKLYTQVDFSDGPADEATVEFLKKGFTDKSSLIATLANHEGFLKLQDSKQRFLEIMDRLNNSFTATWDEIKFDLFKVIEENAEYLPAEYIDWGARTLTDLGETPPTDQWIDRWVAAQVPGFSPMAIRNILNDRSKFPPDFLPKVKLAISQLNSSPSIELVLANKYVEGSWNPEDIFAISKLPVEDYYDWILNSNKADVSYLVRSLLKEHYQKGGTESIIADKVMEALNTLEETSPINKYRVENIKKSLTSQ
jgi:hypothetical protein